jgi:Skp family chaperone for outer membrane proteins
MKNVKQFVENFYKEQFNVTSGVKGDTIQQTQRNEYKIQLLDALFADMKEAGFDVQVTMDGVALVMANQEEGAVTVVFDTIFKTLDYNIVQEAEDYTAKMQELRDKETMREKEARIKYEAAALKRAKRDAKLRRR